MATCGKSNLRSRFQQIREDVEIKFSSVTRLIEERKNFLLQTLDDILSEFEKSHDEIYQAIDLLESNKNQLSESLDNHILNVLVSKQVDQLDEKIAALKLECKEPNVNLKWEENYVNELINNLGIITCGELNIGNNTSTPDYESKKVPILCAVKRGNRIGEISDPRGIAIENRSGNIYVSDYGANRVSVFSSKYYFLFQFGAEQGLGAMNGPHGIHIFQDNAYVTQVNTHCLQIYTLDGEWVKKVGSHGCRDGEFNCPGDSFVDESSEDIYICDSFNNRVQIFDSKLQFKSIFAEKLNDPVRIKVQRKSVIILDRSDPCLHYFSKTGEPLRSIIPRKSTRLFDFELDSDSNIILADVGQHCVTVANSNGELIHQFGSKGENSEEFISPWGLVLTSDGRIITISCNAFGCLKVF